MPWLSDSTGTQSSFSGAWTSMSSVSIVDPDAPVAAAGRHRPGRGPCASRDSGSRSSSSPARPGRSRPASPRTRAGGAATRRAARATRPAARPARRPARRRRRWPRPGPGRSPRRRGRARARASWSRTSTSRRSRARGSLAIGPSASSALVFCEISSAAASRAVGQLVGRLLADEALELRGQPVDLGDVRLLAGEQVLRFRQAGQPERPELRRRPRLAVLELGLHVRPAAQPPVDLDVAQLGLQLDAPAQPQRDGGEDEPDDGHDPADGLHHEPEVGDAERLDHDRHRRRAGCR